MVIVIYIIQTYEYCALVRIAFEWLKYLLQATGRIEKKLDYVVINVLVRYYLVNWSFHMELSSTTNNKNELKTIEEPSSEEHLWL